MRLRSTKQAATCLVGRPFLTQSSCQNGLMRIEQPSGTRGNLKWIQRLAQHYPSALNAQLRNHGALGDEDDLVWLSPLHGDLYAEYRDQGFLNRLSLGHLAEHLRDFWPAKGPQWDGLATDGGSKVFLIEAKAHAKEMESTCQAGAKSRAHILKSCNESKGTLGADQAADWLTNYYQYANRLAHLEFLRRHGVDAWLVFLYFIGDDDMAGPKSESEWQPSITLALQHLGLSNHPSRVATVFQPVDAIS